MKNTKIRFSVLLLTVLFAFGTFLVSCASTNHGTDANSSATVKAETHGASAEESKKAFETHLGDWRVFGTVYADDTFDSLYKDLAKDMPFYTAEGLKAAVSDMYSSPVLGAKFDGTDTIVLTVMKAGKKVSIPAKYKYVGKLDDPSGEFAWFGFEAVEDVQGLAKVKYIISTGPHSHEGGMTHWHARFSGYSFDSLLQGSGYPTFAAASMSKEDEVKYARESLPMVAKFLPSSPFQGHAAAGDMWVNVAHAFGSKMPSLNKKLDEVAKTTGLSKVALIEAGKKAFGADANAFEEVAFVAVKGKNELVAYKGGKEVNRIVYERVGPVAGFERFAAFKAKDAAKAGDFNYLILTSAHGGAEKMHFHYGYGKTPADVKVSRDGKNPTCASEDSLVSYFGGSAERIAKKLQGK